MKKIMTLLLAFTLLTLTGCGAGTPKMDARNSAQQNQPEEETQSAATNYDRLLMPPEADVPGTKDGAETEPQPAEEEKPDTGRTSSETPETPTQTSGQAETEPPRQTETPKPTEPPKQTEAPKPTEQPKETEPPKVDTPPATEEPAPTQPPKGEEPAPDVTEPPKETQPKTAYDYEFDMDIICSDCIAIGQSMGYTLNTSLNPTNAAWWNPVTASETNQGAALKRDLEQYIRFHTLDNLLAYGLDAITEFNICCESRGDGAYAIYFVFA